MTRPVVDEELEEWMALAVDAGLVGVDIYEPDEQFGLTASGWALLAELEAKEAGDVSQGG